MENLIPPPIISGEKIVEQGEKILYLNFIFLFLFSPFFSVANFLLIPFDILLGSKVIFVNLLLVFVKLIISFLGIYKFNQMRKFTENNKTLTFFLFLISGINIFTSINILLR